MHPFLLSEADFSHAHNNSVKNLATLNAFQMHTWSHVQRISSWIRNSYLRFTELKAIGEYYLKNPVTMKNDVQTRFISKKLVLQHFCRFVGQKKIVLRSDHFASEIWCLCFAINTEPLISDEFVVFKCSILKDVTFWINVAVSSDGFQVLT